MRMTRARSFAPVSLQDRRQRLDLPRAEPAGRHQRPGRRRRAEADQRDVAAHPHERKGLAVRVFGVALGPRRERRGEVGHRVAHIGVVVAGREGHVRRLAERPHPFRRATKLRRQRDVDEIAGDRDMVGLLGAHVGDQTGERRHVAEAFAPALPVDVAHEALEPHLVEARPRQRPEMDVGEMGDGEAHRRAVLRIGGSAKDWLGSRPRAAAADGNETLRERRSAMQEQAAARRPGASRRGWSCASRICGFCWRGR